jgi:Mrp family chromosome partitioning ATPase
MHELLTSMCEQADMVLLDSPPTVALSDTAVLSTQTDGVLLVLDARTTRRDVARQAVQTLKRVNAHIVGAVLNRVPTRGTGYYYYYQQYYSPDGLRESGSPGKTAGKGGRRSRAVKPESPTPT